MNNFLVKLTLHIGEYEKQSVLLVTAENADLAGQYALFCESHNPDNLEWDEHLDQVTDMGGAMIYSIRSCREIQYFQAQVLREVGICASTLHFQARHALKTSQKR